MEIRNFYPQSFHDINVENNPALRKSSEPFWMIVKSHGAIPVESNEYAVVLLINDPENKHDRVERVAEFWKLKLALAFCESVQKID